MEYHKALFWAHYFFLIFINDIQFATDPELLRLFADDTSNFQYDKNLQNVMTKMKVKLEALHHWLFCNKLTVNFSKTSYVIFHTKNKKIQEFANEIKIGDDIIKRECSVKYVGMIIDDTLSWKAHLQYIISKFIKFFGMFNNVKSFITSYLARQLYFAFLFPHIEYGIECYGASSKNNIKKLQVIQNKLLRLIHRKVID